MTPQVTAPVPVSPRATATGPVVSPQTTAPDADTELSSTEHSLSASNTVRKRIYLPRKKDTVEQHPTDDDNNEIVELPTDDEKNEIVEKQPTDGERIKIVEQQPTDNEIVEQPTDDEITFIDSVDSPGCSSRFCCKH